MTDALHIAKTGLNAQQTRMSVISNNLANVNTVGFKRDRASFESLLYQTEREVGSQTSQNTQSPTGLAIGTGVRIAASEKLYNQGNIISTDNSLDMTVEGGGFFQIGLQWRQCLENFLKRVKGTLELAHLGDNGEEG